MSRLEGNLLDPITFDQYGECGTFIRDHRCALCIGSLVADFADDHKYIARCPEHGPIHQHNHIHRSDAERIEADKANGRYELRTTNKPNRTQEEIIKELTGGF